MNTLRKPLCLLLVAIGLGGLVTLAQEEAGRHPAGVGTLHRIDLKAEHPKAYHPKTIDLVQGYLDYIVSPEQIVDDLKVTIEGKSIALVGVINTSKPMTVDAGQISVFLAARQAGMATATIAPVIAGQNPKPFVMRFLVQ